MAASAVCAILNATKGNTLCSRALMAADLRLRLTGLLSRHELSSECGLLITPSSGVHTFGMRFPIDIIALDRDLRVIGVWRDVGPWKVRAVSFRTHSVLELSSGRATQCDVALGDQLLIAPAEKLQAA